jgi:LysR family transcriptional regulator, regulator for bpeEF and oprC
MTLDQLAILVKVVEAGSFTRAADVLGLQRPNSSRAIAQLEAELGVTLLERTTRTQSVSEAGRAVYERAVGVLAAVDDARRVVQRSQDDPRGVLRLTCAVEFGMAAVGGWIESFLERYPLVSVEAEYATREIDLVHEGFDLAIRPGPLPESRLVARRLGEFRYGLYASPAYLGRRGLPRRPADLVSHDLVMFTGEGARAVWALHSTRRGSRSGTSAREVVREVVRPAGPARLRVNAGAGVRSALLHGVGIGQLPDVMADDLVRSGALSRVLPGWRPDPVSVFAVYPSNRYLTPKVRAFVDLALAAFPADVEAGSPPRA